ncbi:copper homeostasis protein cutC homolog [Homalodisca vitripennis]|uniref:copper homeostasis protein cutC homolog n=1 Tax=Homalodisca vitripennis TaxID=197043 RepID=UPI001EEBC626|nr:copper homeostasis protein cutC homolog [Homalodisca vitripennis]
MEVCVDSIASAVNAAVGGAARLELCSALSEGGLTPTVGFLHVVKSLVKIPVFVMIRPRRGLDFVYSPEEINVMELDLNNLKTAGADGFVFGALTPSKSVNESVCKRLILAASPLPCTFHRAFDVIENPLVELETIISLGFVRILTSGQEETAVKGVKMIKNLVKCSRERVSIMAGAGITDKNLEYILRETGVREFHASARTPIIVGEGEQGNSVTMGTSDADSSLLITNSDLVEDMIKERSGQMIQRG